MLDKKKNYRLLLTEELAAVGDTKAMLEMSRWYIDHKSGELSEGKGNVINGYLLELASSDEIDGDDRKTAMLLLGIMYYLGRGVHQSYVEAVSWYEKAADKLDSYGLCNLGYCYYYGRDIPKDYEKAFSCFSQSALLNNSNAMYKLGDMFDRGYHVNEDKDAAFYWYQEARSYCSNFEDESPSIDFRLGKCYSRGHGVEQDLFTALKMLQSAEARFFEQIEAGDPFAELTLPYVKEEIDHVRSLIYSESRVVSFYEQ